MLGSYEEIRQKATFAKTLEIANAKCAHRFAEQPRTPLYVVSHEVCTSYNSRTAWPRITKFYHTIGSRLIHWPPLRTVMRSMWSLAVSGRQNRDRSAKMPSTSLWNFYLRNFFVENKFHNFPDITSRQRLPVGSKCKRILLRWVHTIGLTCINIVYLIDDQRHRWLYY